MKVRVAKKLSGVRPPSLPFLAQETKASARRGAKRTLNDNFREVRPLASIVLVAGFEAFNLQLYKQVVSTRGGSLRGFPFSFSILYPVRLFVVFLVLGVRVKVGITEPPTIFPISNNFSCVPSPPGGGDGAGDGIWWTTRPQAGDGYSCSERRRQRYSTP